jgi:hypothetical protein
MENMRRATIYAMRDPVLLRHLLWCAVDLGLPLSFHILTSSQDQAKTRGPKLNSFMAIIRGCQDILIAVTDGLKGMSEALAKTGVIAGMSGSPVYIDGKLLGVICHGGWVPASAGVLKGRTMTCTPGIKDDVVNAGAEYVDRPVVVDFVVGKDAQGRLVNKAIGTVFKDHGDAYVQDCQMK